MQALKVLPQRAAYEITVSQYAKMVGMSQSTVRSRCEQGLIPAFKTDGGHWRIKKPLLKDSVSIEEYEKVVSENAELKSMIRSISKIAELPN